jgi:hypothetical protein
VRRLLTLALFLASLRSTQKRARELVLARAAAITLLGRLFADAMKGGVEMDLPKCQKCNNGLLIPLSDYGQDGASVMFKAWVCTNPDCGFSLRVDKGAVTYGKSIEPKH